MPGPADLAKRLLEAGWPDAPGFFERAALEQRAPSGNGFRGLLASVPRRLGELGQARVEVPKELSAARPHWTLTDYARLWLVHGALGAVAVPDQPGWFLQLFEGGELGEQVSLLRLLSTLPDAERFVETGVQACRHNSLDVFEAIVAENPFLAAYFPPLNFNQAVMKSIFMGVSVRRIEELERRITPELSRMAAGYVSERRAAGRTVPEDADYLSHFGA